MATLLQHTSTVACSFPMAQLCFLLSGGARVLLASILMNRLCDGLPDPCSHFLNSEPGAPFKQLFPMLSHRGLGQSKSTLPSCSPVNRLLTLAPQPQKNSDTTRLMGSRSRVAYLSRENPQNNVIGKKSIFKTSKCLSQAATRAATKK